MAQSTSAPAVAVPTNAGSNKSVPAPAVAVPAGVKKWLVLGLIFVAVVSFIALIASIARDKDPGQKQAEKAAARLEEGCTKSRPCTLLQYADGSTEKVHMKGGISLCVDDSFFMNLPRLGYATSYQGGAEMRPGCTTVSCKLDTFWFTPEAGVNVPKYWFVPEGASRC